MSEANFIVSALKTSLKNIPNPNIQGWACCELLATPPDSPSYIAATEGHILAIVPVETTVSEARRVAIPANICQGAKGKPVELANNGEWRRTERDRYGRLVPGCKVQIEASVSMDDVRFPEFQSVLPAPTPEKYLALKIDTAFLQKLSAALNTESDSLTLLIPPAYSRVDPKTGEREQSRNIADIIPVIGEHGIGVIVPLVVEPRGEACATACRQFNSTRESYSELRTSIRNAEKANEANKVK